MKIRMIVCLALCFQFCFCFSQQKELKKESDGFIWYLIRQGNNYGVQNKDGKTIIPLSRGYTGLRFCPVEGCIGYYEVKKGIYLGACDISGKEILPVFYNYLIYSHPNGFVSENYQGKYDIGIKLPTKKYVDKTSTVKILTQNNDKEQTHVNDVGYSGQMSKKTEDAKTKVSIKIKECECDGFEWVRVIDGDYLGAEDTNGNVLIPTNRKYLELTYEHDEKTGRSYFMAGRGGLKGVCDISGKEILALKYNYIGYSQYGFLTKLSKDSGTYLERFKLDANNIGYRSSDEEVSGYYDLKDKKLLAEINHAKQVQVSIRNKFQQAVNLPSSEYERKVQLYSEILRDDPNNSQGLHSEVYNNIGVIFQNNANDLDKAQKYYEKALKINPSNSIASENLKGIKKYKRSERWNKIGNVLGSLADVATNMSNTSNGYPGGSNMYSQNNAFLGSGFSGGGKDILSLPTNPTVSQDGEKIWRKDAGFGMIYVCKEKNGMRIETLYGICKMCRGTKICSACQGSRQCNICHGKGGIVTSGYGQYLPCTNCDRTGNCRLCQSTGRCSCTNYEFPGYNPGSSTIYDIYGNIVSTTSYTSGSSSSSSKESRSSNSSSKSTCSYCHGTGISLTPFEGASPSTSSWKGYTNSSDTVCPYCNRTTFHQHDRCSHCNVPRM